MCELYAFSLNQTFFYIDIIQSHNIDFYLSFSYTHTYPNTPRLETHKLFLTVQYSPIELWINLP